MMSRSMLWLWVALAAAGCGKLFGNGGEEPQPSPPAPATPKWAQDNPRHGSDNKPRLRLETTPGSAVTVFNGQGGYSCASWMVVKNVTADESGVAVVELNLNDNSSITLYAQARLNGKDSSCSSSFTYSEDSTPPSRPTWAIDLPKVGTANQLTLKGRAQGADTVSVHASADCSGPALPDVTRDTSWGDVTVTVSVEDDTSNPYTLRAVDSVGNAACSAAHTYVEDSQAPAPPVLSGTDPASPSRTTTIALLGRAEPGATVTAHTSPDCSDGARATGKADAEGAFRISGVNPSYNTTSFYYVRARDGAGHPSACVGPLRFVHDSVGPSLSELTGFIPASPANHTTPILAGYAQGGAVKARVFDNSGCNGDPLSTVDVDSAGKFQLQVQVTDNSTSYFYVELVDAAGNWSSCRAASAYVEDSLAPSAPTKVALRSTQGTSRSVFVNGQGTNTDKALLFTTTDCQGEPVDDTSIAFGAFELTTTVAEGSTTPFSVAVRDAAGNRSACVGPLTYLHDATPPSAVGAVVVDGASEDLAHQRTGSTVEAHWSGFTDANSPLRYHHFLTQEACDGYSRTTPEQRVDGTAVTLTGLSLAEGTYYHCVLARDVVGNRSAYVRSNGFRVDLAAPSVAGSTPAEGAQGVDVLAPIVLTFSEAMDAASFSADTLTVEAGGARVEGTLACEKSTCAFKPLRALPYREAVRVTVSTAARDVAGWPLASAHTLNFTTRGRQWSASPSLVQQTRPGLVPDVAVDGQGTALAVWVQGGADGSFRPYAARRLQHGAWSAPQPLDTQHAGEAERPVVAVNAAGHAVAVWELRSGADSRLYAAEYAPETGWGAPQRIEQGAAPVGLARVVVDAQGHALVVFQQRDGAQASVWAVRRAAGAGWGSPLLLEAKAAPVAPALAAEAQGSALAAWVSVDAEGTRSVRASRFSPEGTWTAAEPVAALVDEAPLAAAVSLDGSASVVFRRSSAEGARTLRVSRFVPGTGWEAEAVLGGATTLTEASVAMDRWGRVLAAWTVPGDVAPMVLRLARFTQEAGWQPVDVDTGHASQPVLAADGQGNFHAVWVENTSGEDRVWAARYPEGATALGLARVLEPAHGGTSKRPRLSASAGTGAAVVWYRDNGEGFSSNLVYASAYE